MKPPAPTNLRSRLTLWYTGVVALLLLVYAILVFAFQYAALTRQMLHDEIQDIVTVEGLLYFDSVGKLQLHQEYYSRPQSHLFVDRYMQVYDQTGNILYSSPTLHSMRLGGSLKESEGDRSFDERIFRLADGSHVFLISHVHGMNGRNLIIRLAYSLAPLRDRMEQFLLLLMVAVPIAVALAALGGQAIAKRALQPIEQMSFRAEQITANNLHDRLEVPNSDDELGRMATTFNHLLERLESAFHQLKRFTSDAAHELRTPLASIRTVGEVALSQGSDANARKAVEDIMEETSRLNDTVDSLLLLSQVETSHAIGHDSFALDELLQEIKYLMTPMMEDSEIDLRIRCSSDIHIKADRLLLRVAILNVVHNAWKYSPPQSTIGVGCSFAEDCVSILIEDEGPGIAPSDHERIFDRFFTGAKEPGQSSRGTGLGLSITKLIVERCEGSIEFDRERKSGARCIIRLPIYPFIREKTL